MWALHYRNNMLKIRHDIFIGQRLQEGYRFIPAIFINLEDLNFGLANFEMGEVALGEGNFGAVCLGRAKVDGEWKTVAIKRAVGAEKVKNVIHEAKILVSLGKDERPNPNIVRMIGTHVETDLLGRITEIYLILEYCSRGNLKEYLQNIGNGISSECPVEVPLDQHDYEQFKNPPKGSCNVSHLCKGPPGRHFYELEPSMRHLENVMRLTMDTAKALCHPTWKDQNLVHMDLAAENIMVNEEGGRTVAKVSDLGQARHLHQGKEDATYRGDRWTHRAPECILDSEMVLKSDVWGFGILLFQILSLGSSELCPDTFQCDMTLRDRMLRMKADPNFEILQLVNGFERLNLGNLEAARYLQHIWNRVARALCLKCQPGDRATMDQVYQELRKIYKELFGQGSLERYDGNLPHVNLNQV